ncbi:rod shape-determining protein MreD [Brevibacillus ginsengisoli]|uniref:rod shape-determining protein MreD n=1 Tax=Brevibacillus ginsengisoli TaxID=363854 RepID=UPI003CEEB174
MPRFLLSLMLLVIFLLEGTVFQFILPQEGEMSWTMLPRFALVSVIMIALFLGRREGLIYGFCVGLLQDILFGHVIGVYTFTMMVAGYFSGMILLLFHRSLAVVFTTVALVLFGHEWLLYSIYRLFSGHSFDVQWTITNQILPTVAVNLLFALVVYYPMNKVSNSIHLRKEMKPE